MLTAILVCTCLLFFQAEALPKHEKSTLQLVHVLFRHGNRTANGPEELYPKDPYVNETYFPFGLGQLTNAGKRREFSIGQFLRDRYNAFLGPYYYPEILDPFTTNYNRTKASLELVLASLFPPRKEQVWKPLYNWQPVPYNYVERNQDKVLIGVYCPKYLQLYEENLKTPKVQQQFSQYSEIFKYISENTGLNVTKIEDVYNLYFGLSTEEEWGFKLPEWTNKVWPDTIIELAIQEYYIATATTEMKQLAQGYLLKKIISDSKAHIENENKEHGRKLYLYSGHENNLAEFLILLDVFQPHIPTYGSFIIVEMHKINGVYGLKMYYENYTSDKMQVLKLPACEEFCPLDKFESLLQEYIPEDSFCEAV